MEEEGGKRPRGGWRAAEGGRAGGGRAGGRGRRLRLLRLLPLLVWEGDGAERPAFNPAHPPTPEALTAWGPARRLRRPNLPHAIWEGLPIS